MAKTPKKNTGRPSSFDEAVAASICGMIAEGRSLRSICTDEGMPHISTVFRWLVDRDGFRDNYVRAREAQADVYADEIVDIVDSVNADAAEVGKARLQMDARKWVASKLKPKKYGDKLGLTDGNDGPLTVVVRKFGGGE